MNFLRKILLIAIISVFAGNAECAQAAQTIFDLPENTLGLMKDKRQRKICEQYKDCIHIIVPGTEAHKIFLLGNSDDDECGAIESALYKSGNIYFPADGTQPTTKEAGIYSCANVEAYNLNSSITIWYMRMFGYQEQQTQLIKAGKVFRNMGTLTAPLEEQKVLKLLGILITYIQDRSMDELDLVNSMIDYPVITLERSSNLQFWNYFRVLASDPIGRVLLYRLLIEIRRVRKKSIDIYLGDSEIPIPNSDTVVQRNNCRTIIVRDASDGKMSFNPLTKSLMFSVNDLELPVLTINQEGNRIGTKKALTSADILLFHELLHWYQFLRDPIRESNEDIRTENRPFSQYISESYYGRDPIRQWAGKIEDNELRVILESPNYNIKEIRELMDSSVFKNGISSEFPSYLIYGKWVHIPNVNLYREGDDLSENVYRMSRYIYANSENNPLKDTDNNNRRKLSESTIAPAMRWGHVISTFKLINIPERFYLANLIARKCYFDITNKDFGNWILQRGKAAIS